MLGEEYFFTLIVLFPIHTAVFEVVRSLLVVFNLMRYFQNLKLTDSEKWPQLSGISI